jgi:hypothetical protein
MDRSVCRSAVEIITQRFPDVHVECIRRQLRNTWKSERARRPGVKPKLLEFEVLKHVMDAFGAQIEAGECADDTQQATSL